MDMTYSFPVSVFLGILLIIGLLVSEPASPADLHIIPELSLQEVFTDNVTLSPSGAKSDDFISVINPGITINHSSQRLKADLNYRLQNIIRANSDDDLFQLFNLDSNLEIIKEYLNLDIFVKNGQQNTSNTGRTASDNLSVTDDRSSVLTYSVSPYWQQRFGSIADIDIRFTRDEVNSNINDTNSEKVNFNATSGKGFTKFLWELKINSEKIDSKSQESTKFRDVTATSRYLLTRKFAIRAEVGYEDNKFSSSRGNINGERWNLGFEWNPSIRTSVRTTYGKRFFGTDLSLNITHRTKRARLMLEYSEKPDTTRTRLIEQQVFELVDPFGNRVISPSTDQAFTIDVGVPLQTNEVFIKDTLTVVYQYTLKKNTFIAEFTKVERDFELTRDSETQRHARFSWNWNIGRRTRSDFTFNWNQSKLRVGGDENIYSLRYRLVRTITRQLKIEAGLSYIKNNSNISSNGYEESRIFASLNKTF